MPYLKKREPLFADMTKLLYGYKLNGVTLGRIIGASHVTGKNRLDHPENLTLGELRSIVRSGHIPADELREAIRF